MKRNRLMMIIGVIVLAFLAYELLVPGDRFILLHYNSANEYGRFYYSNGIWTWPIRLNDAEFGLSFADLSPDGSKVVFAHHGLFYTYTLTTGKISPISSVSINTYYTHRIQWSPDGNQIGFTCSQNFNSAEICIFDIGSQKLHILTDYHAQGENQIPYFGSWGPNGDIILYTLATNPNTSGETINSLKIIHTGSSIIDTVLEGANTDLGIGLTPALAPDGKTILFSAAAVRGEFWNNAIYQINSDGSSLHRIVKMEGIFLGDPVWSPDGHSFYASSNDSLNYRPLHFNLKGQRLPGLPFQNKRTIL